MGENVTNELQKLLV